jgi:cyclopropane fatty-acyl-phospholipid synthase-like methyltransferase
MFLAREFGVQVWAADLWIRPTENLGRIQSEGLDDVVFPLHAEAHTLPFAEEFFDAIVSMDAYHYFGTDNLYLSYLAKFLKPGGEIGINVPGLLQEFEDAVPDYLTEHWEPDFWSLHSPGWWRRHWERSEEVEVALADAVPDSGALWLKWLEECASAGYPAEDEALMLLADAGRNICFSRVVARRRSAHG